MDPLAHPCPRAAAAAVAGLFFGAALLAACGPPRASAPEWPRGAHVLADVAALDALLGRFARAPGTPAGERAARLRGALPACALAYGSDPEADLLRALEALRCGAAAPAALEALRAGHAIAFARTLEAEGESAAASSRALRGRIDLSPAGRVSLALELPRDAVSGALALLLPGAAPPQPALLSDASALIRARVRPDGGLALRELVPAASQADRLFHLRSALFSELVLEGSWELAVYLPAAPSRWPRVAAALGIRSRAAAQRALDGFVAELAQRWPLPQQERQLAGAAALCLPELRLLPELAPCAQVGERALAIGWNAASLEHALARTDRAPEPATAAAPAAAALTVELARIPEADALLAGAAPHAQALAAAAWQRLAVGGSAGDSDYSLWAELEPARADALAQTGAPP